MEQANNFSSNLRVHFWGRKEISAHSLNLQQRSHL